MTNIKTRQATRSTLGTMRDLQRPDCPIAQWNTEHPAAMFWRLFVQAGGLDLDPKIWIAESGAADGVTRMVEQALVSGKSAGKVAAAFLHETPERHDWLKVDDGFEVAPCYYLPDYLDHLFLNAMNRSLLAIQVLQGIADLAELDRLDEPNPLPECCDDDE